MRLTSYIARWPDLPFGPDDTAPWLITTNAAAVIRAAIATLGPDYRRYGETAIHASAQIEPGATIKGPAIIGPNCFIAASALLRGGVFLDEGCIIGPAVELKTTFMFRGSKAAHLNFIGDSLIGADVNLEAGSIVANYRNELDDKMIRIRLGDRVIETGVDKFAALIGDGARIGANAIIAPGAVLNPGARVPMLGWISVSWVCGLSTLRELAAPASRDTSTRHRNSEPQHIGNGDVLRTRDAVWRSSPNEGGFR